MIYVYNYWKIATYFKDLMLKKCKIMVINSRDTIDLYKAMTFMFGIYLFTYQLLLFIENLFLLQTYGHN